MNEIIGRLFRFGNRFYVYDPVRVEFLAKTHQHKYSCFYPHQRIMTKFYEKNCDIFAHQIWKKAYPNVDYSSVIDNTYREVEKFVKNVPTEG